MSFEKSFLESYERLNPAQRQAVDQIDGPLMVVAGPGTGKTQLLATRVANILRQTDADPGNILCLTFTESAAANMTERMLEIFGPQAYQVSVNTFHGLGSEIIGKHGEYFYNGAIFSPADEITTGQIVKGILSDLPHSNPLSKMFDDQFTYLDRVVGAISNIKRAGLMPDELRLIIEQNLEFARQASPLLQDVFSERISKKTISAAHVLSDELASIAQNFKPISVTNEPPLAQIIVDTLNIAIQESEDSGKTTALTNWKNRMTAKSQDSIILRDQTKTEIIAAVGEVYAEYLQRLSDKKLYDYDDMILKVIHAIETNPNLKADLQEKYQYILVDEFQDTNDSQMRLLWNLTDYDEQPNVMVVGDDDQAIFKFQGADISNIQSFKSRYPHASVVVLRENYRSGAEVLTAASEVSSQIGERLSTILNLEKDLSCNNNQPTSVQQITAATTEHENAHVANLIKAELDTSDSHGQIAVIARRHSDIRELIPFLVDLKIPFNYERENDVFSSEPIVELELLSRIIVGIANRDDTAVDAMLPRLISHPAWQVDPMDLWQIGLAASRQKKYWLETMLEHSETTRAIGEWLIEMSARSQNEPLETMLDTAFGNYKPNDAETNFRSPLYDYFFSRENLDDSPESYLEFLSNIKTLRQTLRDYGDNNESEQLRLTDFLRLIDDYRDLGKTLLSHTVLGDNSRVSLLTVHKAKGMEFDSVYIINASSNVWGGKSGGGKFSISFPSNMPFAPAGDSADEQLRLLFVAMTRAKRNLTISAHQSSPSGKPLLPLEYLVESSTISKTELDPPTVSDSVHQLETAWHQTLTDTSNSSSRESLLELLSDKLARYKLSATDLNRFVDVSNGGPQEFLLLSLLRFPSAPSAAAAFGTAIHTALQRAHTHLTARGDLKPLEDMIGDFETTLNNSPISERDKQFYMQKGIDSLKAFYDQRIESFNPKQLVEYDFYSDNIMLGDARLTGKIDLIDIDDENKTLVITDYKTGKAAFNWTGKTAYEKIKLHKYREQLLFYKILIERYPRFRDYKVEKGILEFVEPMNDQIIRLELDYNDIDTDEFTELINSVWQKIISLELPNIADFSPDLNGIVEFEKFLRTNK